MNINAKLCESSGGRPGMAGTGERRDESLEHSEWGHVVWDGASRGCRITKPREKRETRGSATQRNTRHAALRSIRQMITSALEPAMKTKNKSVKQIWIIIQKEKKEEKKERKKK